MKEIKFRIIQPNDKPGDYLYITLYPLDKGVSATHLSIYKNDIVNQYTGAKDKNGKEIYEGDIVLLPNESYVESIGGWDRYETDNIISPVFFKSGCFSLQTNEGPENFEYVLDCYEYIEVIGNIYENPELLED